MNHDVFFLFSRYLNHMSEFLMHSCFRFRQRLIIPKRKMKLGYADFPFIQTEIYHEIASFSSMLSGLFE